MYEIERIYKKYIKDKRKFFCFFQMLTLVDKFQSKIGGVQLKNLV